MLSEAGGLLDPGALAIVAGGTALATLARTGWHDVAAAARAAARMGRSGFDADANRAMLARSLRDIRERGHLGARVIAAPDPATARLLDAYLTSGSIAALLDASDEGSKAREAASARAASVFDSAGELAPVFGLVGTLLAITQLMPELGAGPVETVMASIAGAVVSTLYGVLLAHLACFPMARAILRARAHEEEARGALAEWFADELSETRVPLGPRLRGAA
jgi:chemotaxis protein MotA